MDQTHEPRRLDAVADQAQDVILIVGEDGAILDANLAAARTYHYPHGRIVGLNVRDLRRPELLADVPSQLVEANSRGVRFETVHRRADGSEFPCEVSARGIELDGEHVIVSIIRDISERRRAEEAVRRAESLSSKVFHASPIAIAIIDLVDGRYVDVNEEFLAMVELAREQVVGRGLIEVGLFSDPEQCAVIVEAIAGGRRGSFELCSRSAGGRPLDLLYSFDFIELDGHKCLVSFASEISERKQLEEQLRQAQKMEAIGRLAGGVAHDFNNILTAILGQSEILLGALEPGSPHRRHAEQVRNSALRAASLTGQLLAFSRKQVLQPKNLDVNALVVNLGAMLHRLIGEDIELSTELQAGLGHVRVDPGQLEQVILNLVVNGRDAMPAGGRLTLRTTEIEHGGPVREPFVMLEVGDSGVGMDTTTRSHLFEPFFTTKSRGKGTGLGLSTVYGIVAQSGGFVEVDSAPGAGSRFRVYLPRVAPETISKEPGGAPALAPRGHETILLVEDDADVRGFIHEVLTRQGYEVLTAGDGPAALKLAAEHPRAIHLLLTDVIMPRMTGSEVSARMAALRPGVPVLYISGYPGDTITRQGGLGPNLPFVQKPFSVAELADRVRTLIDGATAPRA
ncbi:MAG: PAS domain S-box protein [Polyangia bacterium]